MKKGSTGQKLLQKLLAETENSKTWQCDKIMPPARCPHLYPSNLWLCYITQQVGSKPVGVIKVLITWPWDKIILDYLIVPVESWGSFKWKRKAEDSTSQWWNMRKTWPPLLALKGERGCEPRKPVGPQNPEKMRRQILPQSLQKEGCLGDISIWFQWDQLWASEL